MLRGIRGIREIRDVRDTHGSHVARLARGTRALPGSGPFFAKRQPGADLTVFRAATVFVTPVEHRIY